MSHYTYPAIYPGRGIIMEENIYIHIDSNYAREETFQYLGCVDFSLARIYFSACVELHQQRHRNQDAGERPSASQIGDFSRSSNARLPEYRRQKWQGNFLSVDHLGTTLTAVVSAIGAIIIAPAACSSFCVASRLSLSIHRIRLLPSPYPPYSTRLSQVSLQR
jgi:hypothetical protein